MHNFIENKKDNTCYRIQISNFIRMFYNAPFNASDTRKYIFSCDEYNVFTKSLNVLLHSLNNNFSFIFFFMCVRIIIVIVIIIIYLPHQFTLHLFHATLLVYLPVLSYYFPQNSQIIKNLHIKMNENWQIVENQNGYLHIFTNYNILIFFVVLITWQNKFKMKFEPFAKPTYYTFGFKHICSNPHISFYT